MSPGKPLSTIRLRRLNRALAERFSLEEMRTLCFDMGVNYDSLPGDTIETKTTALLDHLNRQGRINELAGHLEQIRPNVSWPIEPEPPAAPPYKGLAFFDEKDSDLFFGRDHLAAQLTGNLRAERFLIVVGASGSGKSSLVRAGVIAALRRGGPLGNDIWPPTGSADWAYLTMTPTERPLEHLAVVLTEDLPAAIETRAIRDDLRGDPAGLPLYIRKYLERVDKPHLLLLVDQFEEVFTACKDEAERSAFITGLLAAVGCDSDGRVDATRAPGATDQVTIIIALRADYYADCSAYAGLRTALGRYQKYIGPMSPEELRLAITGPAERSGYELDDGLVELMLQEVGDEPGALPLLSHALYETWQRREGRQLTVQGYLDAGGVKGAIAQTAQRSYRDLTTAQQALAREMFLRLTELGEEGSLDTRRRVEKNELAPDGDEQAADLLNRLVQARLLTVNQARDEVTVEVAHEALIREWPTLRDWLDGDRENRLIHRRLAEAAQSWEDGGHNPDDLYRGNRLEQARKWAAGRDEELSESERAFLSAAQAKSDADAAEELEEQEREARLKAEQASAARLRRLGIALVVALAAALIMAGLFFIQRQTAVAKSEDALIAQGTAQSAQATAELAREFEQNERQLAESAATRAVSAEGTARAEARRAQEAEATAEFNALELEAARAANEQLRLMAESKALLEQSPPLALLLAAFAVRDFEGTGIDSPVLHLREVISRTASIPLSGHESLVTTLAIAPDNRTLATASGAGDEGSIRLWDLSNPRAEPTLLEGHDGRVTALAFSPDGQPDSLLASGSVDGAVMLWDVGDGVSSPGEKLTQFEGRTSTIAFSPDGQWLSAASEDGTVRLWRLNTQDAGVGLELVSEWLAHDAGVNSVMFKPDGATLATSSWDGTAKLWSFGDESPLALISEYRNPTSPVRSMSFSTDGAWLAVASDDGIARLWNTPDLSTEPIFELTHNLLPGRRMQINAIAFSPDGRWVVTAGEGSIARLWDVANGTPAADFAGPGGHSAPILDAAFVSIAGANWLATGSRDRTIRLWNLDNRFAAPLILRGHEGDVRELAVSEDGHWLASASGDRTARLWESNALGASDLDSLSNDELVARACEIAGRNLTLEEWQRYFPEEPEPCP